MDYLHSLVMSELEHFWSMTDRSYSLGIRGIQLLDMLRLDGVQFNMTHYVWGNGSDHNLRDGLLVLLTSVKCYINDELSEDCCEVILNDSSCQSCQRKHLQARDGFSISYL